MGIPSVNFFVFAAIVAILLRIGWANIWRQGVLLVANLVFVASFVDHPAEVLPYAAFVTGGFALIQWVRRGVSGVAYAGAILIVLFSFFWLKQYTFLPERTFITAPYLLVGLSYVFFRVMHLVIDARHPEDAPPMNFVDYLNFTLNFTALVSGPVQRYEDYRRTGVEAPLPFKATDGGIALERIVAGLFKILVMAVLIAVVQRDLAFHLVGEATLVRKIAYGMGLAALYPVYLFFNFSGYTDLVIGVARFLGIALPENFNHPFSAASFIEYWNRWHMSLSTWLRTYVYTPLMKTIMRRVRNPALLPYASAFALFVTFFLIGVWHGRSSKFLFFGFLNGFGVAINQAYRVAMINRWGRKRFATLSAAPLYLFAARGFTFAWVSFTLLWFWSDWIQLAKFASVIGPVGLVIGMILLPVVSAPVLASLMAISRIALAPIGGRPSPVQSRYFRTAALSAMLVAIIVVQSVLNSAPPEIVYKDF